MKLTHFTYRVESVSIKCLFVISLVGYNKVWIKTDMHIHFAYSTENILKHHFWLYSYHDFIMSVFVPYMWCIGVNNFQIWITKYIVKNLFTTLITAIAWQHEPTDIFSEINLSLGDGLEQYGIYLHGSKYHPLSQNPPKDSLKS